MRLILYITLALAGCIEQRTSADDPEPDAARLDAADLDAARPMDARAAPDAAIRDARLPDAMPDGARPSVPLARLLSCELDRDQALAAIVRMVACLPDLRGDERTSVPGLYEAWEAGLFAGVGDDAQTTSPVPLQFGCDAWRCLVDVDTCNDARRCLALPVDPNPAPDVECEPGWERCVDDRLVRCGIRGTEYIALDCPVLDMGCAIDPERRGRAYCESDACTVRADLYARRCAGDDALVMCDGAISLRCDAWRPGSRCQSFAIGGEVPIDFCGPPEFGGAGAYNAPVECADDGRIAFTALGVDAYRFDCRAAGYSGCNDRGCVP